MKTWALPVRLDGVPNLYQVSESLYRSGQPTAQGMRNIKALDIRTVINLRSFHEDEEIPGLKFFHIPMKAWHPEREDVDAFLKIVTRPRRVAPVLVHCWHGSDRTGTMCALYRVIVQGWSKEAAIREMTEGEFGFNPFWTNLTDWIEEF
jgi:protein tyrosine/serine phosphatase